MTGDVRRAPRYSFIIPAHNSAGVLPATAARLRERFAADPTIAEAIFVENGSRDDTHAVATRLAAEHAAEGAVPISVLVSEVGMGNALRAGTTASTGDYVVLSADDLPFGFDDIDGAARLDAPWTLAIGSKAHPGSRVPRGALRRLFTFGYQVSRRIVLGSRVGDSQGTIVADGRWLRANAPACREQGFLFSTQVCLIAERSGEPIAEVPVRYQPTCADQVSTLGLGDVLQMGVGLFRLRRETQ